MRIESKLCHITDNKAVVQVNGWLNEKNIAEAVITTGARAVDISSGVERRPGQKDPKLISEFIETVLALS